MSRLPSHVNSNDQQKTFVCIEYAQPGLRLRALTNFNLFNETEIKFCIRNCILRVWKGGNLNFIFVLEKLSSKFEVRRNIESNQWEESNHVSDCFSFSPVFFYF